jgi:hypothetical protein
VGVDHEFGAKIQWDIPLPDGYPWVEIPNKGTDSEGFWGLYNPGLWKVEISTPCFASRATFALLSGLPIPPAGFLALLLFLALMPPR